jgi:hypothetical protein
MATLAHPAPHASDGYPAPGAGVQFFFPLWMALAALVLAVSLVLAALLMPGRYADGDLHRGHPHVTVLH